MRVILTGGGTGGHVYPLLALAETLREQQVELLYCGTPGGLEARLVPQRGLRFCPVPSGGVVGKGVREGARGLARAARGVAEGARILRRFRPDVVVSTGGYAGYPVSQAALLLRIPLVFLEPNARPGVVTRFLGRFARAVCVGMPDTLAEFGGRGVWTGTPLRASLWRGDRGRAADRFGLDPRRTTILAFGGSQGSAAINRAIGQAVRYLEDRSDLQVLHQTGPRRAGVTGPPGGGALRYVQVDYIEEMGDAYAVADLVVARAGAGTCAEITALGLPAVLVPLGAASGHQAENARVLERAGAAVVIPEEALDGARLARVLTELLAEPGRLARMREAARSLSRPDAAEAVWHVVREAGRRR
ncbi:MAG: undecaprenyldiphospho-muramoylpentapeptide beta-N-acetylglucosaminyltransferase [Armatimonadota bacterium]|nr:undecaprenyldiphospho-muramoylpentapeptide beta-N-acetylglucosaminyltransferase [Armatimonadota bacterium]MDR7445343.1 undecaprenyldiphospho-muramoylpentapeptide beta-N-acetylglucosaminyltransferase [Armatimonadota bacterium]MDR7569824.1 undecaprenyldiphospho-muramoylpentapeptide beta-N-acetylglucosaminyltransferase [Armatimonadota bacterium]MDR7614077.1 undecaprenyldiphospho-muramoylpentapeptide beta-N-acetylglucosaminyltransferase [Armatimonadota bacterium]